MNIDPTRGPYPSAQGDICRLVDKSDHGKGTSNEGKASALMGLLGSSLQHGKDTIATKTIFGPSKVIALYFR